MNDYDEMWDFNLVVNSNLKDINRIHPLKQRDVTALVNELQKDDNINRIIIFGSALDMRCNWYSDLDVYVETRDKEKRVCLPYDDLEGEIDLVRDIDHNSKLYKEIDKTGLLIWERG